VTTIQLRYLATVSNSNVDKLTAPDEEPVRLCNYVDVYKNDRITNDMNFMSASATQAEISKFRLRAGDILITKDSEDRHDIAVPAYVAETAPDLVCGYHLSLVRARPNRVRGDFLFWALQSKQAREAFSNAAGGVTRFGLTLDGMKSVRLACPDLPTQKAIANFLDRETARIDQLIEKKQRLLDRMAERERATLDALFSKIEAKRWRIRHLGKLKNGAGFPVELQGDPNQDIAFFKVKHLKTFGLDATITETDDTVTSDTAQQLRATVFPLGTIVFAKIGAALLLGRFSMIGRPACLDNNMAAYVPNPRLIDPHFCLLALSRIDMATMVQPGTVPSLSTEAFNSYDLPLPTLGAQRELVRDFRGRRRALAAVSGATVTSIDRLREFRAALITAAVTGQIDVAAWSKRGEPDRRLDAIQREMAS
jgi:type I restriction enzyme S subunit